ncbi:MAG: HD domain-containing protein [Paludibacteraceae bacterium]|nr:HD domain-containing protein [Paludibacteraceae bacterium]
MEMTLREYIENEILPRYSAFDKGHQRDHAESVIYESLVLAEAYGADKEMAYTIAAFHDLGLEKGRELHHIYSGEILMADSVLPQFFSKEQLLVMREAVEDHRASSKNAPRSIYGAIVAEADRHIDPETILRRTMQFGLKQNPEADFEWHFNRAYEHMLEKYAEGGYMRLWLNSKRNVEGLNALRAIIHDKEVLREICKRLFEAMS